MTTEQRGRHHRRRWLARYRDELTDAWFTPVGQRAVTLLIVAAVLLGADLVLLGFLVFR